MRIEGVKTLELKNHKVEKSYRSTWVGNKLVYLMVILGISVFTYNRLNLSVINETQQTQSIPMQDKTISINKTQANTKIQPVAQYKCDGRQYCSEMRSRAEAEFFTRYCPDTKMDGDHDGKPCENDSRF